MGGDFRQASDLGGDFGILLFLKLGFLRSAEIWVGIFGWGFFVDAQFGWGFWDIPTHLGGDFILRWGHIK